MESRIPKRDALTCFVPENQQERPDWVEVACNLSGASRWYPVKGGHKLALPNDVEGLDRTHFIVEKELWDHEHCDVCNANIPAMTLCRVTESGAYYILCEGCYSKMSKSWLAKFRKLFT